MPKSRRSGIAASPALPKTPTGIIGFDQITEGGVPEGRPTLICGSAGSGKTLFSIEFLVNGIVEFDEPGVFLAFEESPEDLATNVRSLGFNLDQLTEQGKLVIDYIHIDPSEIEESGEFDLDGLFIRLNFAIESIGARRVVIDTLETLFGGFTNMGILRSELQRLFRWLKEKQVTTIITAERGDGALTRHGLEEYVSDCVILLDHRILDQMSTRRLRIVKYRGSTHGTNEYPFLIDEGGISVLPITALQLDHEVSNERVSTGIERLDAMLGGDGLYRGSSILVSGTAGTGKSSIVAHIAEASCRRNERCLYLAFEESSSQIIRNMKSIGLDLKPCMSKGLLRIHAARPTLYGVEMHLSMIHRMVDEFEPKLVVIDPLSNLVTSGSKQDVNQMLIRLIDFLKGKHITAVFTSLNHAGDALEGTQVSISSLIDTWLLVRDIETNGERTRGLYVLKSRGMPHSNQIREFILSEKGISLIDVYVGSDRVLTGSARVSQEANEAASQRLRQQEWDRKRRELQRRQALLASKIDALKLELEDEQAEMDKLTLEEQEAIVRQENQQAKMAQLRRADRKTDSNRKPIR